MACRNGCGATEPLSLRRRCQRAKPGCGVARRLRLLRRRLRRHSPGGLGLSPVPGQRPSAHRQPDHRGGGKRHLAAQPGAAAGSRGPGHGRRLLCRDLSTPGHHCRLAWNNATLPPPVSPCRLLNAGQPRGHLSPAQPTTSGSRRWPLQRCATPCSAAPPCPGRRGRRTDPDRPGSCRGGRADRVHPLRHGRHADGLAQWQGGAGFSHHRWGIAHRAHSGRRCAPTQDFSLHAALRRAAAPTTARRCNNAAAASPARLAGRAGPEARPLARHPPSTGLLVSGLGAGQRTPGGRQPAWPISAVQVSATSSCQRLIEAPCGTQAPVKPRRGRAQRRRAGRAGPG